jgi:ABC-type transporter MlaC component
LRLVLAMLLPPCSAIAGPPADEIRSHIDTMIAILGDPALTAAEREAAARGLVDGTFDLSEAARRALGPRLAHLPEPDRQELVELVKGFFADACMVMLEPYAKRPDRMRDDIRYVGETVDGDEASVRVTIGAGSDPLAVEARLTRRGPRWLIYDLRVRGVSVTENYRAQLERLSGK